MDIGSKSHRLKLVKIYKSNHVKKTRKRGDFICDCGVIKNIDFQSVKSGNVKSCGCARICSNKKRSTHGMSETPEHTTWLGMKSRCYNKNEPQYKDYGGKGVYVCSNWINSFETFFLDMGYRPSSNYSIDRIECDGPYSKSNCRWATRLEQNNNRSMCIIIEEYGIKMNITEWSNVLEIPADRIFKRISKYKWSNHEALFMPKNYRYA